jgi:cell division protein FtsL
MTRALTMAYKISHHYKERIFVILIAAILLVACSYVFLLQKAIVNVVQRQHVVAEAKETSVDVSDLEAQYFTVKNKITIDLAYSKGLKNADTVSYISKKPVTAMASHYEF